MLLSAKKCLGPSDRVLACAWRGLCGWVIAIRAPQGSATGQPALPTTRLTSGVLNTKTLKFRQSVRHHVMMLGFAFRRKNAPVGYSLAF